MPLDTDDQLYVYTTVTQPNTQVLDFGRKKWENTL
jgi:hypothetical protein